MRKTFMRFASLLTSGCGARQSARLTLVLLAALSITLLWASPAKAGTTITPTPGICPAAVIMQSGEYDLAGDVGPCGPLADGIDILASNVTLHLNGHTITGTCDSDGIGIRVGMPMSTVTLTQVRVLGSGTINDFRYGFVAYNSAGSFVKFVTVTQTPTPCSSSFVSFGFRIFEPSSQWKLEGNVVREPGDNSAGIVLRPGVNDCDLVRNDVNNTITVRGDNNTIVNNTANDNAGGIAILGSNNEIHANTTNNNMGFPGLQVFLGASGNSISGNTSLNNTPYDMQDDNNNCVTNKWRGNRFNTANPSCIR